MATPRDPIDDTHEGALVAAFRAGDRDAADRLFGRHFDAVYDFFARKVNGDVSDLVQKTFLGVFEGHARMSGEVPFRAYLFGVARHQLFHHYRARARGAALDFTVSSLRALEPGPSSLVAAHAEQAALFEALAGLPLEQQLLLELRYWEGLTGPALAVVLELPEGTVRTRLRAALSALRVALVDVTITARLVPDVESDERSLDAWAESLRARFPMPEPR